MVRVAINGYGRIGRLAHRIILEKHASEMEVVAINAGSSTDLQGWLYLLKYDSAYGPLQNFDLRVKQKADGEKENLLGQFIINEQMIPVFSEKDPSLLPWGDLQVDVVIESTGHFLTQEKKHRHI